MHMGIQLHAPRGFGNLRKGIVYHFLTSDPRRCRVMLVTFGAAAQRSVESGTAPKKQKWKRAQLKPEIQYLPRHTFEHAVAEDLIVKCDIQRELPAWFGDITIADLRAHDELDEDRKRPHTARIDDTLAHLWPSVQRLDDILLAEDPVIVLNRLARACRPQQNETRYRTAFFTYVAFGLNRWSLHYPVHRIGRWDRSNTDKKFGRPSISYGALHGYSAASAEIVEMIKTGYREFCGPGVHLVQIYRQTVSRIFGCRTTTDPFGIKGFSHPEGKPFPTYGQFAYWVGKSFPLQTRQTIKFGETRVRTRLRESEGRFTDSVGNLMEIVEEDAFQVEEVAIGYIPGAHLPRLWVVRIRCRASGLLVGIGFSVGGESSAAYRMAKASMGLDKVWFCSLFGVTIKPEDWPSQGLPLHEIMDRGPGATAGAESRIAPMQPAIKEMAPSYAGQSKAVIETSHPKAVKIEGAPHFKETRLTIPQLAAREIRRLIKDNHATDIRNRLNHDALQASTLPTPIHVWNYLARRGRTHAVRVPRDEVIRAYFTPTELTIHDGAVYLLGQRYWSKALKGTGLLAQMAGTGDNRVRAYVLDICVRHLFLDTPAGMVTLDAMLAIRDGSEQLYLSVAELEQLAQLRARGQATMRAHRLAAATEQEMMFEIEFGVPFDASTRRRGRAKTKSAASLENAREIIGHLRGRKVGR